MCVVFFVGTFGMNFQMTTALMAQQEFHRSAQAYGILGTLLGGRLPGRRPDRGSAPRPPAAAASWSVWPSPSAWSR